jgi:hypothetical protein
MITLKRVLILFSLVFFFSCGSDESIKSKRINAQKEKAQQEKATKEVKTKDFIYDIGGVIFKKIYKEAWGDYYFYIKLDNDKLIEWETTAVKYHYKEVGDRVHFEYLSISRFSDKAIE